MSDSASSGDASTHSARDHGIPWRRWSIVLHRDVGYLAVALTIAYAISGIAVNHIADWNPNYRVTKTFTTVAPIAVTDASAIVSSAMERLRLTEAPRSSFQPDSNTMQLFYKGTTYHVDLPTGKVMVEATRSRPVLFEMNQLHLNHSKRAWTWIADIYALALLLLAITGLFVLKGKNGITRRGAWLTAAGFLPVVYWLAFLR
ncbi:MAG: PepSY-associated TM helix domain-containing protein [Gemmatimonadaceae bacterium]